jgi:hypothetical protein
MRKLLRTRATDRDADLIVVTDEGHTTDVHTMAEAEQVIAVLANKVRAFYAVAARTAGRQPCVHELDEAGA